ncbi:MAG TPA: peptide chain release factor 1 [Bacillota bacterium]|jgi:peptide chain release factor 1|nr:peptide chain release factor 1 [Fastidiosipila sp.]HPX93713.1 peptide chain release factor 1 [Bacillota bacterium]HQB81461.1 peptide chain release factor 1 [Bacillota bacterium]
MEIDQYSKLTASEARYEELSGMLADTDLMRDQKAYIKLAKEHADLQPLVNLIRELRSVKEAIEENRQLMNETDDAELRELAREEIAELETRAEVLDGAIREAIEPKDEKDQRDVIVEIRAGTGGEEAALFAADLYRMYAAYAEARGWETEIVDMNETEIGGFKEIIFTIEGEGAYSRLKYESGAHRVQRVPVTEAGGRIHTSAVTVAVLPEADEVDFEIDPKDLQIDTYRASGAGGQHVNKTSSAIRITHLPTGVVVTCQDQRSQYKNKDKAMAHLRAILLDRAEREQADAIASERKSQVGTGDRSERIRTYNFPQSRVTDHRIGLTLYKLDRILAGDLDEIIDALQVAEHEAALQS